MDPHARFRHCGYPPDLRRVWSDQHKTEVGSRDRRTASSPGRRGMYLTRPSLSLPEPPDAVFAQRTLRVDAYELAQRIRSRVGGMNPVSAGRATRSAGAKGPRSPTRRTGPKRPARQPLALPRHPSRWGRGPFGESRELGSAFGTGHPAPFLVHPPGVGVSPDAVHCSVRRLWSKGGNHGHKDHHRLCRGCACARRGRRLRGHAVDVFERDAGMRQQRERSHARRFGVSLDGVSAHDRRRFDELPPGRSHTGRE